MDPLLMGYSSTVAINPLGSKEEKKQRNETAITVPAALVALGYF